MRARSVKEKRKTNSGRAVGGEDSGLEMTVAEMIYIMENEEIKECIWVKAGNGPVAENVEEEAVVEDSAEDEIVVKTETKAAKEPVAEEPAQEGSREGSREGSQKDKVIIISSSP